MKTVEKQVETAMLPLFPLAVSKRASATNCAKFADSVWFFCH
jgi:hypothetical protein